MPVCVAVLAGARSSMRSLSSVCTACCQCVRAFRTFSALAAGTVEMLEGEVNMDEIDGLPAGIILHSSSMSPA